MDYIEFTDYWIYNNNTIIIKPSFNNNIDLIKFNDNIISLVFSKFNTIDNCIKRINNNKYFNIQTYKCSQFNLSVDNLPQNLQNIIFGYHFNQTVDNLPQNLQNLTLSF